MRSSLNRIVIGSLALMLSSALVVMALPTEKFSAAVKRGDAKAAGSIASKLMAGVDGEEAVMGSSCELMDIAVSSGDKDVVRWVAAGILKGAGEENVVSAELGIDIEAEGTPFQSVTREVSSGVNKMRNGSKQVSNNPSSSAGLKTKDADKASAPGWIERLLSANGPEIDFYNQLVVGYDDNVDRTHDKEGSTVIRETVGLSTRLNLSKRLDLDIRYQPSFVYKSERQSSGDDDKQLFHRFFGDLSYEMNPTLNLNASETFQYKEQPETIEDGDVARGDDTYYLNEVNLGLEKVLRENMKLVLNAQNEIKRYENDDVADSFDVTRYKLDAKLEREIVPDRTLGFLEGKYSQQNYVNSPDSKGNDAVSLGVGVSHALNPELSAQMACGITYIDNQSDLNSSDSSEPYANLALNYAPSPRTVFSANMGYSYSEDSTESSYASSMRQTYQVGVQHDITKKLSLNINNGYYVDRYASEWSVAGTPFAAMSGETKYYQFATMLNYRINRIHSLNLGYEFSDMQSDIRENWDRNVLELGWKVNF